MVKGNNLYRRLWYVRRRNQGRIHIFFRLVVVCIVLALTASYFEKMVLPPLLEVCEVKARENVAKAVEEAVKSQLPEGDGYNELVAIDRDANGRILSLQVNAARLNSLSADIAVKIQENLKLPDSQKVAVPLGVLLGNTVFSASGPGLQIKIHPIGSVQSEFKSEFEEAGVNQTRHSISLKVKTTVGIMSPLADRRMEIITDIPVADTIIVGSVHSRTAMKK